MVGGVNMFTNGRVIKVILAAIAFLSAVYEWYTNRDAVG